MMLSLCKNWKPTLTIYLSILILAGCIVIALCKPALWTLALSIIFVNYTILSVAGLIPRSKMLGANITRLPQESAQRGEVAITIDDGPDPTVTPQVLDILDRYHSKATFFCIGKIAARYPELCREIIRRGHAIENHSLSHQWYFSLLNPRAMHREVQEAQTLLSDASGQEPQFFRPTAGLRNPILDPVLAHCKLRLCCWSKRGFDTRVSDADVVYKKLTNGIKGGDILLLHDGNSARNAQNHPVILSVLPRLLNYLAQEKLRSVTLRSAMP